MFAGEIIYSLPFHITRFYRPTFLEVFQLNNTQLGDIFSVYGIMAMLAYFPGGLIADLFSARKLMSISLLATALGGVYLYTLPSALGLTVLFAWWGLSSVMLFWAAMIKATREIGVISGQGFAFGVLEGGRGLVASVVASVGVVILAAGLIEPSFSSLDSSLDRRQALQSVVAYYTGLTILAAMIIWLILPNNTVSAGRSKNLRFKVQGDFLAVLADGRVWLQGGIVLAIYCGFKALDNYGVYAVQVLGMSEVESAEFVTLLSYSRPIAAIVAGLLVDKWIANKMVILLFTVAAISSLMLGVTNITQLLLINLIFVSVSVYALRGVQFTLLESSHIDVKRTGAAVGLISLLGYTPDIFFASLTGRILDANPGLIGFQYYFFVLTIISILGLLLSIALRKAN